MTTPFHASSLTVDSNKTGEGDLVFATSPTLVTPILGAAQSTSITTPDIYVNSGSNNVHIYAPGNTGYNFILPINIGGDGDLLTSKAGASQMIWTTSTGTGSVVKATSPTLVTPILGAAQSTSITTPDIYVNSGSNNVHIYAPGNTGYNFILPTTVGAPGQVLTSQGGGTQMTWSTVGTVPVSAANGGTGIGVQANGEMLISNGTGWQTITAQSVASNDGTVVVRGTGGTIFGGNFLSGGTGAQSFTYTEGTYAPTVTIQSNAGGNSGTSAANSASWSRIGKIVTLTVNLDVSGIFVNQATAYLTFNLPFSVASTCAVWGGIINNTVNTGKPYAVSNGGVVVASAPDVWFDVAVSTATCLQSLGGGFQQPYRIGTNSGNDGYISMQTTFTYIAV